MNIVTSLLDTNFTSSREGHNIRNIILHTMFTSVSGKEAYFRSPDTKASSHYGVDLNGDIRQWVIDTDTAWQTDNNLINLQAIGIEHEDNASPNDSARTDALYNASAELVAELCKRYDIPCKLVAVDVNHMPIESGIIMHNQVSLSQTECPAALDVNRIVSQAQAILDPPAPEPANPVIYEALPAIKKQRVKNMANGGIELWDLTFRVWEDVKSLGHLNAGDEFDAVAIAHHPLGGKYYMTAEDYNNNGQSEVPYRPQGANVDDLEDHPEEVAATVEEAQLEQTEEISPAAPSMPDIEPAPAIETVPDISLEQTSEPEPQETVETSSVEMPDVVSTSTPEHESTSETATTSDTANVPEVEQPSDPEPTIEPSQEEVTEVASEEPAPSEPMPPTPEIAYNDLPEAVYFVTIKSPTSVYDLDMETFAKITAIKELAEGISFKAVSIATVMEGDQTTYYYIDDQNQAVRESDLQEVPISEESQEQVEVAEPSSEPESASEPEAEALPVAETLPEHDQPEAVAIQKPLTKNEGPIMQDIVPPKPNPNSWMKSYEDLDEAFTARPKSTYQIEDLSSQDTFEMLPKGKPINIVGIFHDKDGHDFYLSENCAYPKDKDGKALPRRWLGIDPAFLEYDVDSLSNETIIQNSMDKAREKVIAGRATMEGLLKKAFMKTKRG